MIKEVSSFIALKVGLIVGTNLFVGHRPQDAPDDCDCILETAGGGVFFDLPDRVDKHIQVLSRAKTYFTARARAWAIYDVLHRNNTYGSAGWTLPNVVGDEYIAMVIEPITDPQYINLDEKLRHEFSCNYVFKIRDK